MSNVFDDFNRADSPTLGTATTGQTWANVGSAAWGIVSNAADDDPDATPGLAVISSGFRNTTVQATVLEVTAGGNLNSNNWGLIFCYVDSSNYYRIAYDAFEPHFIRLGTFIAGVFVTNYAPPHTYIPVNGDVISVTNCDEHILVEVNGATLYTVAHTDFTVLNGTSQGIMCGAGVVTPPTPHARWDDFSVVEAAGCGGCGCIVPTPPQEHEVLQPYVDLLGPSTLTGLVNTTNVGGSLFRSGGVGGTGDAYGFTSNFVDGTGCAYWEYRQFFSDLTTNNLIAIYLTDEFNGPNQYGHIFNNFFGLQRVAWHHGTTTDFSLYYGPLGNPAEVGWTVGFRFAIYYVNGQVFLDQNVQGTTNTNEFESLYGGGQPWIVPNDRRWRLQVYVIPAIAEGAHSPLISEYITTQSDVCVEADWSLPPLLWTAEATVTAPSPPPRINTMTFDAGAGNPWVLIPSVSDSGDELRSKNVKSPHVTGRLTNPEIMIYGYDIDAAIDTNDLLDGLNSSTGAETVSTTTGVAQTARVNLNVPNAVLHTVRLSGDDTGNAERDEIHEIVVEQAIQGVRR